MFAEMKREELQVCGLVIFCLVSGLASVPIFWDVFFWWWWGVESVSWCFLFVCLLSCFACFCLFVCFILMN